MATTAEPPVKPAATPQDRVAARMTHAAQHDPQFIAAKSLPEIQAARTAPGVSLAQAVKITMEGYGPRPALGKRARELVTDPRTGRSTLKLLPRFETCTYDELWGQSRAIAAEWHADGFTAGDMVCLLGFTSPDYAAVLLANMHRGGVNVPLQTAAPPSQHRDIMAETEPRIYVTGIEYIELAVDGILMDFQPGRLIVMDYDARDDDQRDALAAGRARLAAAGSAVRVDTLDEVIARGRRLAEPEVYSPAPGEDPLAWLFYTSGSTGTPKGVIFWHSLTITQWQAEAKLPMITLSFMPMSHGIGNGYLLMALAAGGTSYCSPRADLSTLFEDLALVRPTISSLVPRVCELLHHHFMATVDKRLAAGADPATVEADTMRWMREEVLGGRLFSVGCGSASLAPETYAFMEAMLDMHMAIGYSSTEIAWGTVMVDWKIQRPPVEAYKLRDVPELGYFSTDKPHPRGELLVKSSRFMGGYYKRPDLTAEKVDAEGFYATGDVMAELAPDHLVFVDRSNNVIKLSQGEFVAISRLEALYMHAAEIAQVYLYGSSERPYLVGVVVPGDELRAELAERPEHVRQVLRAAMQRVAEEQKLNSWELPRDFIVEGEPFSLANKLLTEVGKHARPNLRDHYVERLEALYAKLAADQIDTLRALRTGGAERPVIEVVQQALQASLGVAEGDVRPEVRFVDLGGDSLSALTFSTLLGEIYGVEVPVGVIINPAGDLAGLAAFIEALKGGDGQRASFFTVHSAENTEVYAHELTLDKFIPAEVLAAAPALPAAADEIASVLVTGVTGFLGRFQMMEWLERLHGKGKVHVLARGHDAAGARARVEDALASDPVLLARFRELAEGTLEVLAGDMALPGLGLDEATLARLAHELDAIVHPAAHVNHVLPYHQLFAANVAGTADLIRLALTTRKKHFHFVSTLGVIALGHAGVDEDGDIRAIVPSSELDDSYANGYGTSKWAGEVLLREAHALAGIPAAVFRPGMILAHATCAGQLNVPDMFTRLVYSLAVTGIAPATFYAQDLSNGRPGGRYDGLPVDLLAKAITAIGVGHKGGYQSYNLSGPTGEGSGWDEFVDWMIDAGCDIERVAPYDEWLRRFETAMLSLPEDSRAQSVLAILGPYRQVQTSMGGGGVPAARWREGCAAAGLAVGPVSAELIGKYVADLRHLGWLD
ncbi:MAG: thioester reductase domain-containing protein [Sphingomonadales bacterium]|nr:thioester reductase domain-containing protein [Sphingomonadales bacterium]